MTRLADILTGLETGSYQVRGSARRPVGKICYDSRTVRKGDVYVAVNGKDDKAVQYVPAALKAGAAAIICDAPGMLPPDIENQDVALVVVPDARRAMAEICNYMANYPSGRLRLLGVTGTNGKTTTTYLLRQLLQACGLKTAVIGTLGKLVDTTFQPTGYTTPESPELVGMLDEMAGQGMQAVAMEVSSHALALYRVWGLRFAGAIFTNLTQDHLDFHGTMPEYLHAKKMLFDNLDADCPGVVNADDPAADQLTADSYATILRYGAAEGCHARITGLQTGADGSGWTLELRPELGGGRIRLRTPLLGRFNVWNLTAAFTLALALGYEGHTLAAATASLQSVPGRMQPVELPNGVIAVVDYAHTPDALEHILLAVGELRRGTQSVAVVFGCGGNRDRVKRPLMGEVAARLADRVIVTSDNPRTENPDAIIDQIMEGIPAGKGAQRIPDRAQAIRAALHAAQPGDIVVIAGKGHESYQITDGQTRHFDDTEQVLAFARQIRQRGEVT